MSVLDHERLRKTFDDAAELCDRARSGYPPELFDDLDFLLTYSGHWDLPPDGLRKLLNCIAHLIDTRHVGHITKCYPTELRVAHVHQKCH